MASTTLAALMGPALVRTVKRPSAPSSPVIFTPCSTVSPALAMICSHPASSSSLVMSDLPNLPTSGRSTGSVIATLRRG